MYNKGRLIIALLVSSISYVQAEDNHLEDMLITSTAFDAQVKSISSKQLEEEQASDIKDILKSLPSVMVDGNVRYGQKVYVRGLEDKFANITIDGAKMSGQLFHHSGDQTIDASLLKISSVELGPNSALSGPGVVNGSFKYETKDPSDYLKKDEVFGGKVSLGYETARERKKGSVAVFSKLNDKIEFVGIGTISDDGTLHLGNGKKEANKESRLESGLIKFVFKPNEYSKIKLSYNRYEDGGNRTISGEKIGSDVNEENYNSISRDTYTFKYEYNPNNDFIDLETNIYSNKQYMTRRAYTNATTSFPERKYINSTKGFDIRNTSIFGINNLTYGTDFTHEKQEIEADGKSINLSSNASTKIDISGGEVNNHGLYFQDELMFDKLTLTLGARYDIYKLGGIYDGTFRQLSPKMKLKYQLTDNLSLRTAYGRIFKGPALGETLMLDSSDTQVSDTKAQTGHNYEVGFDYDLTQLLNADNSIIGFNVYRYNLDDYADSTKNNSLESQGDIELWGFETMFSYEKNKLGLNLSHTYTDGEQTNTDGLKYDPKTAKIHVFKLGLNYKLTDELKINYNSQLVPGNDYITYSSRSKKIVTFRRSGYGVHNINFTYKPRIIKNTTINFGISNIFDKDYVRHSAFGSAISSTNKSYELGRNFKFQVSYKF